MSLFPTLYTVFGLEESRSQPVFITVVYLSKDWIYKHQEAEALIQV